MEAAMVEAAMEAAAMEAAAVQIRPVWRPTPFESYMPALTGGGRSLSIAHAASSFYSAPLCREFRIRHPPALLSPARLSSLFCFCPLPFSIFKLAAYGLWPR